MITTFNNINLISHPYFNNKYYDTWNYNYNISDDITSTIEDNLIQFAQLPNPINISLKTLSPHVGYFPHLTEETLNTNPNGFKKINDRQGYRHMYGAGALYPFADNTLGACAAFDLVTANFPPV